MNVLKDSRTALIIGASGLVGGHCLDYLLQEECYTQVTALLRRPLLISHPKLVQVIINFDQLDLYANQMMGDDIYCTIGTTVLKSPSYEQYLKIDFAYPVEIANIAFKNGAKRIALVSALSANPNAFLFYSRVKGKLEETINEIPFQGTYIFRPSYLMGDRKEFRLIEKIGVSFLNFIKPILIGPLKRFRTIEAKAVAFAMVKKTVEGNPGIHLYQNPEIAEIAEENKLNIQ